MVGGLEIVDCLLSYVLYQKQIVGSSDPFIGIIYPLLLIYLLG